MRWRSALNERIGLGLHIAVATEPIDSVSEGLPRRRLRQAQFADGLGRIEEHFVFGHSNPCQWSLWGVSGETRNAFIEVSGPKGNEIRHLKPRSRETGNFRQYSEGLFH